MQSSPKLKLTSQPFHLPTTQLPPLHDGRRPVAPFAAHHSRHSRRSHVRRARHEVGPVRPIDLHFRAGELSRICISMNEPTYRQSIPRRIAVPVQSAAQLVHLAGVFAARPQYGRSVRVQRRQRYRHLFVHG